VITEEEEEGERKMAESETGRRQGQPAAGAAEAEALPGWLLEQIAADRGIQRQLVTGRMTEAQARAALRHLATKIEGPVWQGALTAAGFEVTPAGDST
jgi:hypothetical protein